MFAENPENRGSFFMSEYFDKYREFIPPGVAESDLIDLTTRFFYFKFTNNRVRIVLAKDLAIAYERMPGNIVKSKIF
jgi:hypothetical protein